MLIWYSIQIIQKYLCKYQSIQCEPLVNDHFDPQCYSHSRQYSRILSVMWPVNHSGGGPRGVWMSCGFSQEKKRGVFVPGRAGAQLACSLLFVLIELHSIQLIPLCPPPPACSHPQHLIRQLTPPSVVSAGGGSVACQMLGWESLLFWRMNVCFSFSLSLLLFSITSSNWPFGK